MIFSDVVRTNIKLKINKNYRLIFVAETESWYYVVSHINPYVEANFLEFTGFDITSFMNSAEHDRSEINLEKCIAREEFQKYKLAPTFHWMIVEP